MDPMIHGTYNYWLVALSFGIAMLTSYTAITLAERVRASWGSLQTGWLSVGALAVGTGLWCMHSIGMLAFRLPIPVRSHVPTAGVSLLVAILTALVALLVVSRQRVRRLEVLAGGVLVGGGMVLMYSLGLASMRMGAVPVYGPARRAGFVVVAILISYLGLHLLNVTRDAERGRWVKATVAAALGLTMSMIPYAGMAAVRFQVSATPMDVRHSIALSTLATFAILRLTLLVLGVAAMASIVDRRMSAQNRRLDSERKMLRALIDHIPDLMYVKDMKGRFVLANLGHARHLGMEDPRLLTGKSDFDLYPFDLAAAFREDELHVMSSGEAQIEQEEKGLDLQGNLVTMLTTKVPLRDGNGRVTGIAGVGRDITALKEGEAALRIAERKYRSMYNEALVGFFSLDAEGRLLQVNPAMVRLMGYAGVEEMYALLPGTVWTRALSKEIRDDLRERIHRDGHVKAYEMEVLQKDGERIWISCSVQAKYDGSTLAGYDGLFEDITERRLLREQLLQAQKLESVGQLAAGIAHEINTPVQYIGDNVRFLRDTFDDLVKVNRSYERLLEAAREQAVSVEILSEVERTIKQAEVDYLFAEIPKAIAEALEGVSRVAGIIGAMKEFSHPGRGQKVPLDLHRAIESTVAVTRNEWKYVADLEVHLDPRLKLVSCLPGEFNQVILNLIINAAHSIADVRAAGGSERGIISIDARNVEGGVEIRVKDTGTGIPEGIRSRIFDPFFTTKEIGRGTGQGLAIARSVVVDKHQGSIEVETEVGRGTTFIIRLPAGAEPLILQPEVAA